MLKNHLGQETSPYLLQHKDNPVHWQGWNKKSLQLAQDLEKPILLSVGYAACHWCHVMAHESFEDEATAKIMNEHFINIKVDREERPDLDTIYQKALQITGEQGGWPLTMFLMPNGKPFFGGTYFPPKDGFGRPGFKSLLNYISTAYNDKSPAIKKDSQNLFERLQNINKQRAPDPMDYPILLQAGVKMLPIMDQVHGGTSGAPKFPQTQFLNLFFEIYAQTGAQDYLDIALLSLKKMSDGGIYDHLGGGYSRYSTDAFWFAPHFEKMLYDNALILESLSKAWVITGDELWKDKARETINWLKREMMSGDAFVAALDADSEGVEGLFYTWTENELDEFLDTDAEAFKKYYKTKQDGNWEGRNILHRLEGDEVSEDELKVINKSREKLLTIRDKRIRPQRDDKILSDWNGMMISALVSASKAFDEPEWLELATHAFQYITKHMMDEGNHLSHSMCQGKISSSGLLDDYANMSRAAIHLFEALGDMSYLTLSQSWMRIVAEDFSAPYGGYYTSPKNGNQLIVRPLSAEDNATLSANAVAAEVLTSHYYLLGSQEAKEEVQKLFDAFSSPVNQSLFGFIGLILANNGFKNMLQLILIGNREDNPAKQMERALNSLGLPQHSFQVIEERHKLDKNHPAYGKEKSPSGTLFICRGQRCSLPLSDPSQIKNEIEKTMKELNHA